MNGSDVEYSRFENFVSEHRVKQAKKLDRGSKRKLDKGIKQKESSGTGYLIADIILGVLIVNLIWYMLGGRAWLTMKLNRYTYNTGSIESFVDKTNATYLNNFDASGSESTVWSPVAPQIALGNTLDNTNADLFKAYNSGYKTRDMSLDMMTTSTTKWFSEEDTNKVPSEIEKVSDGNILSNVIASTVPEGRSIWGITYTDKLANSYNLCNQAVLYIGSGYYEKGLGYKIYGVNTRNADQIIYFVVPAEKGSIEQAFNSIAENGINTTERNLRLCIPNVNVTGIDNCDGYIRGITSNGKIITDEREEGVTAVNQFELDSSDYPEYNGDQINGQGIVPNYGVIVINAKSNMIVQLGTIKG